jgi:hypothetical protein
MVRFTLGKDRFNCRQFNDLLEKGCFSWGVLMSESVGANSKCWQEGGRGVSLSNAVCFARVIFLIEIM